MKKIILALALFMYLFTCTLHGQRGQWITLEKQDNLPENISIKQLKAELMDVARKDAIAQIAGQQVYASQSFSETEEKIGDTYEVFEKFTQMMSTEVQGRIIEEKEPIWKLSMSGQSISLSLKYEGKVAKESGKEDPAFTLEFSTTKSVYQIGEPVEMVAKVSKDAYLTVFSILPDNSVSIIFPNAYMNDNKVGSFQARAIPNENEKSIIQFTTGETDVIKAPYGELLLCLATKNPISFDALAENAGYGTAFTKINQQLMRIPREERVQAFAQYMVVK